MRVCGFLLVFCGKFPAPLLVVYPLQIVSFGILPCVIGATCLSLLRRVFWEFEVSRCPRFEFLSFQMSRCGSLEILKFPVIEGSRIGALNVVGTQGFEGLQGQGVLSFEVLRFREFENLRV